MPTLGIITDTHIPQRIEALPPRVFEVFRGADRILHAGDINSRRVLDQLAEIAPVDAVAGNADLFRHGLPLTCVIEVEERRMGWCTGMAAGCAICAARCATNLAMLKSVI